VGAVKLVETSIIEATARGEPGGGGGTGVTVCDAAAGRMSVVLLLDAEDAPLPFNPSRPPRFPLPPS
jgi:hypothetical protein